MRIAGVVGISQFTVGDVAPIPLSARPRLVLTKTMAHLAPYEYAKVFQASSSRDGMVLLVTQRVESGNRHFTEGCMRVYDTDPARDHVLMDGVDIGGRNSSLFSNFSFLLSSGVEDYFDSASVSPR